MQHVHIANEVVAYTNAAYTFVYAPGICNIIYAAVAYNIWGSHAYNKVAYKAYNICTSRI